MPVHKTLVTPEVSGIPDAVVQQHRRNGNHEPAGSGDGYLVI
jgi:hypothetical protein